MKKFRVGIVGIGFGTQVHLPSFRLLPNAEVVALCSTNLEKVKKSCNEQGVTYAFGNWKEMISSGKIDILSLAVPPKIQEEILKTNIQYKLPVFVEKPVGVSLSAVKEISSEYSSKNIPAIIDFEFCNLKTFVKAKEYLKSTDSKIEKIEMIWNVNTYANKERQVSWKTHPNEGGVLGLFGSHTLYNLEWIGGKISNLSAKISKKNNDTRNTETVLEFNGGFESGTGFQVKIDTNNEEQQEHTIKFTTSNEQYLLQNLSKDYMKGFEFMHGAKPLFSEGKEERDGRITAVSCLAAELLDWVVTKTPKRPNLQDGYRVQYLMEAIRSSSSQSGAEEKV